MSEFHELIKSFPKTRDYVRDFFVYGFKSRTEFKHKSPRTYDNERRRLESWLSPYVRKDFAANGSNISLSIDSNLLDTNPLFQVWKTKSFTDNDIVLHFLILDLLSGENFLSAEEITDRLLTDYESLFDIQTVRRKCNAYAKEGLLNKTKTGKSVVFSLDLTLALWVTSNTSLLDALSFYQMAGVFGIIGNYLSSGSDSNNRTFRVKHSFFVHTLEDEILSSILHSMREHKSVTLAIKSSKRDTAYTVVCIPLLIMISTRSGRRFLCGYTTARKRFTCYRLDTIKRVTPLEQKPEYDFLLEKLNQNRRKLWGVSFQSTNQTHVNRLTMTLRIYEPHERHIIDRLKREGRGGTVTKTGKHVYTYEKEAFDCNEMLPWIRTFIGRILSLKCTDKSVEQRFYRDLQEMYQMYRITENNPKTVHSGNNRS